MQNDEAKLDTPGEPNDKRPSKQCALAVKNTEESCFAKERHKHM